MDLSARAAELTGERRPFVRATVVRAQQPTSTRPGDRAIVLPDGMIEGFVGGHCVHNSVRRAALDAVASGESVLLRILPDGGPAFPDAPGADVVVNPCLSGGAMEIFLEPCLPAPIVAGGRRHAGRRRRRPGPRGARRRRPPGHLRRRRGGCGDRRESRRRRTCRDPRGAGLGVGYVGLVASSRRGAAIVDELDLDEPERAVVHTPAGLPIGARTPGEIAVSIAPNWCARSGPDSWIRLRPRRNRMRPSLSSIRGAA